MRVLGIETSCDETGVAVYDTEHGLRAHALHTQAALHQQYGGVVPELASRDHIHRLLPLIDQVLAEAELTRREPTAARPMEAIEIGTVVEGEGEFTCAVHGVDGLEGVSLVRVARQELPAAPLSCGKSPERATSHVVTAVEAPTA